MRWATPRYRSRRTIRRFAWLPVRCNNDKCVWLELYSVEQEWIYTMHGMGWSTVATIAD